MPVNIYYNLNWFFPPISWSFRWPEILQVQVFLAYKTWYDWLSKADFKFAWSVCCRKHLLSRHKGLNFLWSSYKKGFWSLVNFMNNSNFKKCLFEFKKIRESTKGKVSRYFFLAIFIFGTYPKWYFYCFI